MPTHHHEDPVEYQDCMPTHHHEDPVEYQDCMPTHAIDIYKTRLHGECIHDIEEMDLSFVNPAHVDLRLTVRTVRDHPSSAASDGFDDAYFRIWPEDVTRKHDLEPETDFLCSVIECSSDIPDDAVGQILPSMMECVPANSTSSLLYKNYCLTPADVMSIRAERRRGPGLPPAHGSFSITVAVNGMDIWTITVRKWAANADVEFRFSETAFTNRASVTTHGRRSWTRNVAHVCVDGKNPWSLMEAKRVVAAGAGTAGGV